LGNWRKPVKPKFFGKEKFQEIKISYGNPPKQKHPPLGGSKGF
jgi:hypothetical protein